MIIVCHLTLKSLGPFLISWVFADNTHTHTHTHVPKLAP